MKPVLFTGLGLTLLLTAALVLGFGRVALVPAAAFGMLATAIQLVALHALRRGLSGSTAEFFKGAGYGMALRFLGVVLILLAVTLDRDRFPPLPTALGYVGVVIPLLFLEVRFAR